jgi:uncharacterized tellurite resistance protein B-like protein
MTSIASLFESGEQARGKGHFKNLVMVARMDGEIDEAEQHLLNRMADRLSLTKEQISEVMEDAATYATAPPVSREERYERFIQLIQMCIIDGALNKREEQLVRKFGLTLGMTEEKVNLHFPIILKKLTDGHSREEVLEAVL